MIAAPMGTRETASAWISPIPSFLWGLGRLRDTPTQPLGNNPQPPKHAQGGVGATQGVWFGKRHKENWEKKGGGGVHLFGFVYI
jgi:hypothetical protein